MKEMVPHKLSGLTVAEWLQLERENDTKYEYYDGEIVAMAGGSFSHVQIADNFLVEASISIRLNSGDCEPFGADCKLRLPTMQRYVYTDGMIVCDPVAVESQSNGIITNPTVIVEVISDTSEKRDRGIKLKNYRRIPSLEHYVIIEQDKPYIDLYSRRGQFWLLQSLEGIDQTLPLAAVGIEIPLAALYRRVQFD